MSWALVATAAAGLNAGAGLHCALVENLPPSSDPALVESYFNVFRVTSGPKLTASSTLAAVSAAAALGAYFAGGDTPDPAWITCSLVSGIIPLYNALVVSPTAAVVSNPVMADQPFKERQSWMASFARKSWVSAGLASVAFGCTLLVLGSVGAETSSNPLRFTR